MTFRHSAALVLGAAAIAFASPVLATPLALDEQSIAAELKALQLPAELADRNTSIEEIDSDFGEDAGYTIYLSRCTDHKDCKVMQFYAGYTDSKAGLAEINEFNRNYRFSRAVIDKDNEPALTMDVRTEAMSKEEFASVISDWHTLMEAFSDAIYAD